MVNESDILRNGRELETIDTPGNYDAIKALSSSKSFKTWLESRINIFRKRNNLEVVNMLEQVKSAYLKFHPELMSRANLESWKSKSTFDFIKTPEYYKVTTWEKPDQDHEAKPINHIIYKSDLNNLIQAFNKLNVGKLIKTKELAREYCIFAGITHNCDNDNLFEGQNKIFSFKKFFLDRSKHLQLNIMLRLFNELNYIKYRGGFSQVINNFDIQTLFP